VNRIRPLVLFALLMVPAGCSGPAEPAAGPGDPKAVEFLESHAAAIMRGDWRTAYVSLSPELKATLPLKRFTDFHARRRKLAGSPGAIQVIGSERSGEDVIVSFDGLFAPSGGGQPVPVPPRRKVRMRRLGASWALMTHDILAVGPRPEF
jgi:hypothetical protein